MHETVPRCPHARNEKPGGASARAAAPRPARFLVTPDARAQDPALCAHSGAPPWGRRERAPPRSGAAWASLSGGEATPAGARPSLAPAIAMCPCQADVNASAVGV